MSRSLLHRIRKLEDTQQARKGRVHIIKIGFGQNPEEIKMKYFEENTICDGDFVLVIDFVGKRRETETVVVQIERPHSDQGHMTRVRPRSAEICPSRGQSTYTPSEEYVPPTVEVLRGAVILKNLIAFNLQREFGLLEKKDFRVDLL